MKVFGEVTKSIRGMPWRWKAKKDVVTCDKSRRAGSKLLPGNLRMRKLYTAKPYNSSNGKLNSGEQMAL
jgi:hypothetical protein